MLVAYVSMWGATARLVEAAVSVLSAAGLPVAVHDLGRLHFGRFSADLVESRALVLGTPTLLGGPHAWAAFALGLLRALKPPLRFALILSSHGWAGGAVGPSRRDWPAWAWSSWAWRMSPASPATRRSRRRGPSPKSSRDVCEAEGELRRITFRGTQKLTEKKRRGVRPFGRVWGFGHRS